MTLLELVERVEAATGPDRELELAVWRALNPIHAKIANDMGKVPLEWLHAYTSSLDAAVTLVPEKWEWAVITYGGDSSPDKIFANCTISSAHNPTVGTGATPSLALLSAALQAHARIVNEDQS